MKKKSEERREEGALEEKRLGRRVRGLIFTVRLLDTSMGALLLLALLLALSSIFDMQSFARQGEGGGYPGMAALSEKNPDTAAWLRMEGTGIDHPVLQGKDNFEYLDRAPSGEYYAGGSLFLDAGNARDFHDPYNMIHGHHMEGGAMFGDLGKYLEQDFFEEHSAGELLTPEGEYALTVLSAGIYDAYDPLIYSVKSEREEVRERILGNGCGRELAFRKEDRLLALSTCAGSLDDKRTVVFCRMRKKT